MRRVVQSVRDGSLLVREQPDPPISATEVLVATRASLISSGTERNLRTLASASMLTKARARPDLVRRVVRKARQEGAASALRAVRSRLSEEMPLGYSAAGIAVEVGEAVRGIRPGQAVATAGAGHADLQIVAGNLTVPLPDGVSFDEAAFGAVAAIALHGLRLGGVGVGDRVAVVGLGLVGQLACRLALAAGSFVAGTDLSQARRASAADVGAFTFEPGDAGSAALDEWSRGRGADVVVVAAATKSSEPALQAAALARDRATVVVVGDVGLNLDRRPLYDKELTVRVARSYGPGRYDVAYEDWGVDLPLGYVPWTAGRNIEAFLGLAGSGRLQLADLISHRYPFEEVTAAYETLESDADQLAILLEYAPDPERGRAVPVPGAPAGTPSPTGAATGVIGAGNFAREVLLPAAIEAGFGPFISIASGGGGSSTRVGQQHGFRRVVVDGTEVASDPDVDVVFVVSRHDSHARYVVRALVEGKHVFCEKPLALTHDELDEVEEAWREGHGALMVGFNRRWAPAIRELMAHFVGGSGPLHVTYHVNAGSLPEDHWLRDRRMGGRLLGEGCHFVDTCMAIVDDVPDYVYAVSSGREETALDEDFTVVMRFPKGDQATVVYASGGPLSLGKEQLDVIGRGRSARLEDYRVLTLRGGGGKPVEHKYGSVDKGHRAELRRFREMVENGHGAAEVTSGLLASSRVTLAAAESLTTGGPVGPWQRS